MDLYRGVMYETFRAHVRADAQPQVIILSAQHGFIQPDAEIAPYDARMTADRAETMLSGLSTAMAGAAWPDQVGPVFLAGGMHYRRVMRGRGAVGPQGWCWCYPGDRGDQRRHRDAALPARPVSGRPKQ
ncbi:DUF6884 domain-containing protein [Cupriavidus sp. CuC1]|uniref:DUF6884 domain-containing protein n=1 Tax=Cupriavidus sp. CuC1 TaxID=3373131 RepID=UPI0037D83CF0